MRHHGGMSLPDSDYARRPGGMNSFLGSVFLQMAASVALSAAAAVLVLKVEALQAALFGPAGLTVLGWVVTLAPLGLVIVIGAGVEGLSGAAARGLLALYAVLVGLSVGVMFIGLAGASIVATFLIAASAFMVLGFIGFTTERDLSGLGSFLTIVLVGLVVAMLVNLFLRSAGLDLVVAAIGILLFAGLPHMTHSVSSASTRSSHPCPVAPAPAWGRSPSISTFSTSSCRCCALREGAGEHDLQRFLASAGR